MSIKGDLYASANEVSQAPEPKEGEALERSAKGQKMAEFVGRVAAVVDEPKLHTSKLFPAYILALSLIETLGTEKGKPGARAYKEKPSRAITAPGPNAVPGAIMAGDFYTMLGVKRDASRGDIDQAYRTWAKDNHPDVLRSRGGSPEEISKAEEQAILMGEAYNVLKSPRFKPDYDAFWDENFAGPGTEKKSLQNIQASAPQLNATNDEEGIQQSSGDENAPFIDVSYNPRQVSVPSVNEAQKITEAFRQEVGGAGKLVLSKTAAGEMKFISLFPEKFSQSQVSAALQMFKDGIDGAEFASQVLSNTALSQAEREQLLNIAYFNEALASSGAAGLPSQAILGVAASNPAPKVALAYYLKKRSSGMVFTRSAARNLSPEIQSKVFSYMTAKRRQAVANMATKGIKAGAKKLAKTGSKVAVQAGAKVAAKAGISATITAVLEAVGISTGGPLGAIIAAILSFLIVELVPLIFNALKKLFDPETIGKILWLLTGGLALAGAGNVALLSGIGALGFSIRTGGFQSFVSTLSGFFSTLVATLVIALGAPILVAALIIPTFVAIILVIMNSGAYVVPPWGTLARGVGQVENPYIDVEKVGQSETPPQGPSSSLKYFNSDLKPLNVIYTITITAKRGPLTNVQISYECNAKKESGPINCPPIIGNIPNSPPNGTVNPTESFVFTYQHSYTAPAFEDSSIVDIIRVTADVEGVSTTGIASASVCIGDCPQDCPSIWPILPEAVDAGPPFNGKLTITQGPEGNYSHSIVEAIDVSAYSGHTVYVTHEGVVNKIVISSSPPYGTYVDVLGNCAGKEFVSRYAHLLDVSGGINLGQTIQQGVVVGLSGNSGTGGAHLHYEFRSQSEAGGAYTKSGGGGPPWMEFPYLPKDMGPGFRGCGNNCGLIP